MKRISEYISYFESQKTSDSIDTYFSDPYVLRKVSDLKIMLSVLGDIELSEDYMKVFLYELSKVPYKTSYEELCEMIRIIYGLSSDLGLKREDLVSLFTYYHQGVYRAMFDEIKISLGMDIDLSEYLRKVIRETLIKSSEEASKLEYLKVEYSEDFIKRLQDVIKRRVIPCSRVIDILPSKEFIDISKVKTPLGYDIVSGEDLVVRRLDMFGIEKEYEKASSEERLVLGYASTGDKVYTSFTKGEYELDLKRKQSLKRERS